MVILHISSITNNQASGMSVVVPLHVQYQNLHADVALLNCSNIVPNIGDGNFPMFTTVDCEDGDITKLPSPYNKPDLVIIHGLYIPFYSKIVKVLLRNKLPYILVPHGSLSKAAQDKKRLKKLLANLLIFDRIVKKAKAIQYLSEEEQKTTIAKNTNSFIGCNGMNIGSTLKHSFMNEDSFKMIFIGRLDPFHKGIDLLLQACNGIKSEMRQKKIILSIYGPDHEGGKNHLTTMINDFDIRDIVSINDGLFGKEKMAQLLNSDIFIQTSRFEGQPLGVMEALANGVPVIVTPGTNMADDVKNNNCGWKSDSEAEDIGRTIIEAYNNKDKLNIFSHNAVKFIKDNFEWTKVTHETVEKYKEILR
ncbi:glycosyltransferase [Priestia sp. YIM B13489]|uniref:glycosyltransferase n=1 Tax=Priestia sp. YIM B13489 TaxID=3366313 RepID=UPI00366B409B